MKILLRMPSSTVPEGPWGLPGLVSLLAIGFSFMPLPRWHPDLPARDAISPYCRPLLAGRVKDREAAARRDG